MTYNAAETSVQSGSPVELYTFARNAVVWRYTSGHADVTLGADTYLSDTLSRSSIETTQEQARNALTITARRDFPIADLFRLSPPSDVISVTVQRYHRRDGDDELAVIWKGRVLNADWKGAEASLRCEPVSTSLSRIGLQRLTQTSCPHVLYGRGCNIDKSIWRHETTVSAVDGVTLTCASINPYAYNGGFVEYTDGDGNIETRFILSSSGSVLTLSRPFAEIAETDAITVYPGCDHTLQTCFAFFANHANYGGTPFIPRQNPFGGDPIF